MKKLKYTVVIGTPVAEVNRTVTSLNQIAGITAEANTLNINTIITVWYPSTTSDLQLFQLGILVGTILYPIYKL